MPIDPSPDIETVAEYYRVRAGEYDRVYLKPEQQSDFAALRDWLASMVHGKDVLEIACGTGYWTSAASKTARSIVATDVNESVLQIAGQKPSNCPVEFWLADAYDLPNLGRAFDVVFCAFWLSHVPKQCLSTFLTGICKQLRPGGQLLFIDSKFVEGYRKPPAKLDSTGNRFDLRRVASGATYDVVKNYLSEEEMRQQLGVVGTDVGFRELDYLWSASVTVPL